jgi:hypothetical protein
MNKSTMIFAALLLAAKTLLAQTTDPMLTSWWFNTTGNTYNSILTDVEAVYYTATDAYVKTSGVPNYYRDGVSHNNAKNLHAIWDVPRSPVAATTPTGIVGGQMGIMLDGSVFFHPGDAQSYNGAGVWNRLAYYFEGVDMDAANGHSTPDNVYHHHFDNLKLHNWDSATHSPIVGYAWDGYPVYGPYGYKNTDGTGGIKRMTSSYVTYTYITRTNGPAVSSTYPIGCFIEDWHYVAGSGDLDAHNGRFCKTPEYPSGTYAYFTTVDASLKPYYPYFIGPTYYGTFSGTNLGPSTGVSSVPGGAVQYVAPNAVDEVAAIESNVELFPIPVVKDLTIQLKENRDYQLTIYDMRGAVIDNRKISRSTKINMRDLSYGVYFVQLQEQLTGSGFIKRIVKQ